MAEIHTLRHVLALRLEERIATRGVTLAVLAGLAGISRSHLHRILGEESAATVDVLERLAEALDCEPGDLLRRRDR